MTDRNSWSVDLLSYNFSKKVGKAGIFCTKRVKNDKMYGKWHASVASEKFLRKRASKVLKNVNFLNKSEIRGEQPPPPTCCYAQGLAIWVMFCYPKLEKRLSWVFKTNWYVITTNIKCSKNEPAARRNFFYLMVFVHQFLTFKSIKTTKLWGGSKGIRTPPF